MRRVVIVSNRVSVPGRHAVQAGGLAVVLCQTLRRHGGLWFGWSGTLADEVGAPRRIRSGKVEYVMLDLTHAEHELYYNQYANATLWPLLHHRLGLVEYNRAAFRAYLAVNERMAAELVPLLLPDDLVWVHDYHLIPFAAALRRLGSRNRIAFFLHTPFPPPELLAALPQHEELLRGLAAYDVVGVQTETERAAMLNSFAGLGRGRVLGGGRFAAYGGEGIVLAAPVGIEPDAFARLARSAAHSAEPERLRASLADRRLIIGVDRLDYTKGIPGRFAAIETLLSLRPEQQRRFTYLQITPHSRSEVAQYRSLRSELEALAGRINSQFAEYDWTPIRYVNRPCSRSMLAGFYRLARAALVTPFRDGMNLVAKEFVAAQDPQDPGVLILSHFAGAARELDGALPVNPLDRDEMAAALDRALLMPKAERQTRWQAMFATLRRNSGESWSRKLIGALEDDGAPRRIGMMAGSGERGAGSFDPSRRVIDKDLEELLLSLQSVWTLEVLLLLLREADRRWTEGSVLRELRASQTVVKEAVATLGALGLVTQDDSGTISYRPASPLHPLVLRVSALYRERPTAVTLAIHDKPTAKLRSFANSFKIRKD